MLAACSRARLGLHPVPFPAPLLPSRLLQSGFVVIPSAARNLLFSLPSHSTCTEPQQTASGREHIVALRRQTQEACSRSSNLTPEPASRTAASPVGFSLR